MKIFEDILQPPEMLKDAWRKMIPLWAWDALRDDVEKILTKELPMGTPIKDVEIMLRNAWVFIKREAFFPICFLKDIVDGVYNTKLYSNDGKFYIRPTHWGM